jgi:hypothetical protein
VVVSYCAKLHSDQSGTWTIFVRVCAAKDSSAILSQARRTPTHTPHARAAEKGSRSAVTPVAVRTCLKGRPAARYFESLHPRLGAHAPVAGHSRAASSASPHVLLGSQRRMRSPSPRLQITTPGAELYKVEPLQVLRLKQVRPTARMVSHTTSAALRTATRRCRAAACGIARLMAECPKIQLSEIELAAVGFQVDRL